jgi:hypothetical protein
MIMKAGKYLVPTKLMDKSEIKVEENKGIKVNHNENENYDLENPNNGPIHKENKILTSFIIILLLIAIFFLFTACYKSIEFVQSTVVLDAHGYINVSTDNNNNYVIKIHISDLADSERLQPPKKSYVAWIETDQGNMENIGQLTSSSNFISNKKEAVLKTVSSFKPRKIFITAEDKINIRKPGNIIVLSTKEFN